MSNERNIHSASRPRRRMGPGRGMVPGEKAKDLKGALGKILRYMGKYKIAVVFVMIIAACSTVFSVLGPKVLGKATTGLAEGLMAKVAGITKTNTSVFPEKRGNGYCARLDTRMESVKVLGLVNITVLAAGSIFTGSVHEPIKGTKNPQKMLQTGIPFTKKPVALQFDYKVKMSDRENRIRATGFSKITDVPGKDYPAAILFLQKRWEDAEGNVYAKRIGTMVTYYYHSTDWKNNVSYEIMYGDITSRPEYKAHMMRLQVTESYTVNSKGESVPIHEVAWGDENDVPTHLCLQFTSSHGGAYIGSPGNTLWIDNVKLVY